MLRVGSSPSQEIALLRCLRIKLDARYDSRTFMTNYGMKPGANT